MIGAVTSAQNESADQYAQAGGLATEMLSGIYIHICTLKLYEYICIRVYINT
jgi:hypothetical protein